MSLKNFTLNTNPRKLVAQCTSIGSACSSVKFSDKIVNEAPPAEVEQNGTAKNERNKISLNHNLSSLASIQPVMLPIGSLVGPWSCQSNI